MATDQGVGGSNPLAHVWESLENTEFSRDFLLHFPLKHTNCMGKLNIRRGVWQLNEKKLKKIYTEVQMKRISIV